MADDAGEPQGSDSKDEPQGSNGQAAGQPAEGDKDQAADWQALARKWERQAKKDRDDLVALKKQVQTLLTPEQVADKTAAAAEAKTAAQSAQHEALKLRVALEKGVPADLADRLVGDDREALERDATTLLSLMGAKSPKPASDASAGSGRPKGPAPTPPDPNALLRTLAGRY